MSSSEDDCHRHWSLHLSLCVCVCCVCTYICPCSRDNDESKQPKDLMDRLFDPFLILR
jgi:hypothetical protein